MHLQRFNQCFFGYVEGPLEKFVSIATGLVSDVIIVLLDFSTRMRFHLADKIVQVFLS